MSDSTFPDTAVPSDPTSLFGQLRQRRAAIEDALKLRLKVPHWAAPDPEIIVTYRPLQASEQAKIIARADKVKGISDIDRNFNIACDCLIAACVEVVGVLNGQEYSFGNDPHGPRTRFDAEMAERLQLENKSARSVLQFVFLNDGDLVNAYGQVPEWSAQNSEQIEDELLGE